MVEELKEKYENEKENEDVDTREIECHISAEFKEAISQANKQSYLKSHFILIMGENGQGKSSLANTILHKETFKISGLLEDCTLTSELDSCIYNNVNYYVMDTPGLNFQMTATQIRNLKENIQQKLIEVGKYIPLEINTILLVHKFPNRVLFQALVAQITDIFEKSIVRNIIMIITNYDQLILNSTEAQIEEIKENYSKNIQEVLGEKVRIKYLAMPSNQKTLERINKRKSQYSPGIADQRIQLLELIANNDILPYQLEDLRILREQGIEKMDKFLGSIIADPKEYLMEDSFDMVYIPITYEIKMSKSTGISFKAYAISATGIIFGLGTGLYTFTSAALTNLATIAATALCHSIAYVVTIPTIVAMSLPFLPLIGGGIGMAYISRNIYKKYKSEKKSKTLQPEAEMHSKDVYTVNDRLISLITDLFLNSLETKYSLLKEKQILIQLNLRHQKDSFVKEMGIEEINTDLGGVIIDESKTQADIYWKMPDVLPETEIIRREKVLMAVRIPHFDCDYLESVWAEAKKNE